MQWLLNGESSLQSSAVASLAEASALRPVIPAVRVIEMGRKLGPDNEDAAGAFRKRHRHEPEAVSVSDA